MTKLMRKLGMETMTVKMGMVKRVTMMMTTTVMTTVMAKITMETMMIVMMMRWRWW